MSILFSMIKAQQGVTGGGGEEPGTPPAAPTNFVVDNPNKRFSFTKVPGYPDLSSYEFRVKFTTWEQVTADPQEFIPQTAAIGEVEVRVKALNGNPAGNILSNGTAYTFTGSNVGKIQVSPIGDSNTAAMWSYLDAALDDNTYTLIGGTGQAGYMTFQITPIVEQVLVPDFIGGISRHVCVLNMGTNDINNGRTAQSAFTALTEIAQKIRRCGYILIVAIPANAGNSQNQWAQHPIYRSLILNGYRTILGAEKVIDISVDPFIGVYNGSNGYWADGLHYTAQGYNLKSQLYKAAIDEVCSKVRVLPAALTGVTFNDTTNVLNLNPPAGYNASDFQITRDDATVDVQDITIPYSFPYQANANELQVRIKGINGNAPSPWFPIAAGATGDWVPSIFRWHKDPRFTYGAGVNQGNPSYAYAAVTTDMNNRIYSAFIDFTEGFKFVHIANAYANSTYEFRVDGAIVGTGTANGIDSLVFEYHTGTNTVKELEIYATAGAYAIYSGITLFGGGTAPTASTTTVGITEVYKTTATVSWTKPNPSITSFVVERATNQAFTTGVTQVYSGPLQLVDLTGLTQNTTYWIRAKSLIGTTESAWSEPISFKTFYTPAATFNRVILQADKDANVGNPDWLHINVGDYLIDGYSPGATGDGQQVWGMGVIATPPALGSGKKVCIMGGRGYDYIFLNMVNNPGSALGPTYKVVTNVAGQVRAKLDITNCNWVKITGKYDTTAKTGDANYPGFDTLTGDWSNLAGSFGFHCKGLWTNTQALTIHIAGDTNNTILEGIEGEGGNYTALSVKNDGGSIDMDGITIRDCYFHDTPHGENIYLGSTQADPQMQLVNTNIKNNIFARAGLNGLQVGQMRGTNTIENNVFISQGTAWSNNFQKFQDQAIQLSSRKNGFTFRHNLVLGGGENYLNFFMKPKAGLAVAPSDTSTITNNAFLNLRGYYGSYVQTRDGFAGTVNMTNNYFGRMGLTNTYNLLYPGSFPTDAVVLLESVAGGTVTFNASGNTYDTSTLSGGTFVKKLGEHANLTVNDSGNNVRASSVEKPTFSNYADQDINFDYGIIEWWTARFTPNWNADSYTGTNGGPSGALRYYNIGDIVFWQGRFYKSKVANNQGNQPTGNTNAFWELMIFSNGSTIPPDDVRLVEGSFYENLGMGLTATVSGT